MDARHDSHPCVGPAGRSSAELRRAIRSGDWSGPTTRFAVGWAQANVVVLPAEYALEAAAFFLRNGRACPLLEITEPGNPSPVLMARDADIRTDVPRYRVYRDGELTEERQSIAGLWRDDLVTFLLGCSFTFEQALVASGVRLRHVDQGRNVAMYRTGVPCVPAGRFHADLVVSMRPVPRAQVGLVSDVCAAFETAHGPPLGVAPEQLGIGDLLRPDFGDPIEIRPGEVPVFWACGVTAEIAAASARPDLLVTHAPGHMFITDLTTDEARRSPRS